MGLAGAAHGKDIAIFVYSDYFGIFAIPSISPSGGMVDAMDSKSIVLQRCAGSSPASGTRPDFFDFFEESGFFFPCKTLVSWKIASKKELRLRVR